MLKMMYKNYVAKIEYSSEDDELVGVVVNTSKHGISFSGKDISQVKRSMIETIDAYLMSCKELNINPDPPDYSSKDLFDE